MKTIMNPLIALLLVCLLATVDGWPQQTTAIEQPEINFSSPPKGNLPFQGSKSQSEVQTKAGKKHGELQWYRFGQPLHHATPSASASAPSQPSASASVAPISGTLGCNVVNGDYWIMSREIAAANVQDFCNQHDKTKVYNGGSDNELLATVTKSDMGSAAHSIRSETASHRSPGMEMRADTCFTTTRLVSIAHSQGERDR
jgi:hypothetical protein